MELKQHNYKVSFVNCGMRYDYIIVGQGLAGALLAYVLLGRRKRLLIIDRDPDNNASHVAAGLINPITGPKMVKSWKADMLFPFLDGFYSNLEASLRSKFFHQRQIYRPFSNMVEQNDWQAKWNEPQYSQFVNEVCNKGQFGGQVNDPFGGLIIKQSGHIDMKAMLNALATFIKQHASVRQETFKEDSLEIRSGYLQYGQYTADKIVFCTGYHQSGMERFFGWLPVQALKGEILEIKTDRCIQTLYNRGCFIIPMTDGLSRAGSTYHRHDLTTDITEKGREEIRSRLSSLLSESEKFIIVGQTAGLRPVSPDRRPMLGIHPEIRQIYIFNGLGTKGVTLAPYFATQLVNFLENGDELDMEVNIKRFYSLYYEPFIVR